MEEKTTISLRILNKDYSVKVKQGEKDLFLRAVETIKENIRLYATKTANNDKQDLMAMVLIHVVVSGLREEERQKKLLLSDMQKAVQVNALLDSVLKVDTISEIPENQVTLKMEDLPTGEKEKPMEELIESDNTKKVSHRKQSGSANELTLF